MLAEDLPNLHSIRIGTKALAYWPHRFTEGEDADDFMRLIGEVKAAGKHLALMAHFFNLFFHLRNAVTNHAAIEFNLPLSLPFKKPFSTCDLS